MSTIGMMQPGRRSRDRFVAAVLVLAVPSIALAAEDSICLPVLNEAVPPGGSIQFKVPKIVNEPTPIIVDLQGFPFGADLGAVQGVTLPEAPDAAGSAVNDGSSLVIRTVSPSATLGLSSDPTVETIAVPVGTTATLTLDPAASGLDPFGNPCVLDPLDQVRSVVEGTVSITDVLPGGGFLPAGSLVTVVGIGFQPEAQVLIDGIAVASASWVDSSRIEVVTAVEAQLDGRSLSVSNPDGTGATYVSYLRATDLGKSARPLLAATEAIFPVQTQSSALFAAPASGTFFGLALQNPEPADSIVSVELWDAGSVVASASLVLPPRTKVSREVSELFPGVIPSAGSLFQLTATVPVQMLGLSGNETDGSVTPVLPALASP
jgi:hypothetical protein